MVPPHDRRQRRFPERFGHPATFLAWRFMILNSVAVSRPGLRTISSGMFVVGSVTMSTVAPTMTGDGVRVGTARLSSRTGVACNPENGAPIAAQRRSIA